MVAAENPCDERQEQGEQHPPEDEADPEEDVEEEADSDGLDAHAAFLHGAVSDHAKAGPADTASAPPEGEGDRKSTRLNSSHT